MRAACRRRQGPKILKKFGKIFFENIFETFFRKIFSDRWHGVRIGWARRAVWWWLGAHHVFPTFSFNTFSLRFRLGAGRAAVLVWLGSGVTKRRRVVGGWRHLSSHPPQLSMVPGGGGGFQGGGRTVAKTTSSCSARAEAWRRVWRGITTSDLYKNRNLKIVLLEGCL